MCRRVAVIALGLTFLVFLSAMPAKAMDDILKLVPDSALGLVVVNCPSDADAKLQELGRQMQLPRVCRADRHLAQAGPRRDVEAFQGDRSEREGPPGLRGFAERKPPNVC